jgi:YidC/Oxa1 family membrane protein insertase
MAIAMFVQQRASQKNMPTANTNPSMQLMSGPLMAVMFGVMFYQVPSGLVLYWLTNSLMSLAWYRFAK